VLDGYSRRGNGRIEVAYVEPDRALAAQVTAALGLAVRSLAAYFEVEGDLPTVRAVLAPDRDEFDRLVADLLHVEIERPSDPRRVAQTQKTDIVLLSPSAYAAHSAYSHRPDDFRRMVWHEAVHVVEEFVSPNIEAAPLWWSEGLAICLSGQWQCESPFRFCEPVLEAVRASRVPTLAEVRTDHALAYAFGWTLVRFVEKERGKGAVVRVVREMRDGDVLAALGEDAQRFEARWRAWLTDSGGDFIPHHT